ncbi:hypothetical protein H6P81_021635 [Aristolochia fimbriata]|uniref:Uncharacterized protein n=1 Tax=Aristolochia fimbriata TaxID=158543 RepID=A0AAV7DPE1_ARIFI|nr:hypothetical protein H6P81_021635 [Aristolochia fimbriata]
MAMVDFFIENKGTFFPYHYITYGSETALVIICENGSIMKSMAMVDFFIENKKELSSHIITLPMETRQALVHYICENGSIMKSMAMVDFFIENKRNFLPISLHYLWKQDRALVIICENGSIMKSMAMVDFFIENKGKLQLKQQDIINHTKVGKCVNFCVNRNFLPISLHYLWKQTALVIICENGSIMKSMAMVDFFIENKETSFGHYICENGSIMKSMAMVDFFIENKGTFFPYHYITYGNSAALVIICENGSIMKSMAMVDFFIENKRQALVIICENGSIMKSMAMVDFFIENKRYLRKWVDNEIHGYNSTSSLKIKELSSHIITLPMETDSFLVRISAKNGSIMKSMAMVDFFIENKGKLQLKQQDNINHTKSRKRNFLPISLHYLWKQNALVIICENGSIMKSMAMVDFFIENKKELSSHIITLPMETEHALVRICENGSIMKSMAMVDFFIENKGKLQLKQQDIINHTKELSSHIITLPMETERVFGHYICENGSIMKSMAMVDFFIENKRNFLPISLHYLWKSRQALVVYAKMNSIMKSMAIIDFFIENKGKLQLKQQDNINHTKSRKRCKFLCKWELSSHIITLPMETENALVIICENGSIMKSMAMVDFFIENKRNFLPISLHYLWKQTSALN